MRIIINLGQGNLQDGCHSISVQLLGFHGQYLRQFSGSLPPAPQLDQLLHQWQRGYRAYYQEQAMRISLLESEGMRYSEAEFKQVCREISQELNNWLASDNFAPIEKTLRTELNSNQPIQIILNTTNLVLQQLPWHLWSFVDDYPQAEIAFSSLNWQKIRKSTVVRPQVRILAILGNGAGIDLQQDLDSLEILPQAELTVLREPKLLELNEYLWQPQGWDILLFSGHSCSSIGTGYIYLNASENITIAQLKKSLIKAIANGLQIAIFNSCEGMGLGMEISDLSLPYGVVMGEPVPDKIAQVFLKYFLTAFVAENSFTLAVKEARHKLAGWETEYICASWLPTIWQNPLTNPLTWSDLKPQSPPPKSFKSLKTILITSLIASSSVMLGRSLAWLEPLELWAYDHLMQQRPAEVIDSRILVVEVTEDDTNSDSYPLSDQTLVEALNTVNQYQPAAIGLDIHRATKRGAEYPNLIQMIENNPRLFPVCAYGENDKSYAPPLGLSETKLRHQMGFSDLLIDNYRANKNYLSLASTASNLQTSFQVRRQLLSYDPSLVTKSSQCLTPYSLSFQLAYEYLSQEGINPLTVNQREQWQFGDVTLTEMTSRFGGYQQLDGQSSQIALNYRSAPPGKRVTMNQLLSGKIPPQLIANRIVLIGYTASVARDYFDTPYGAMPGVWIHAHMTSQIISAVQDGRSLIWVLPQWGDWLWIFGWSVFSGLVVVMLRKQPVVYSLIYYLIALGILILVIDRLCLLLLIKGGWFPYVPTFISLFIVSGIILNRPQRYQINQKILKNPNVFQ